MGEYTGEERRDTSWHVEKKVSVSHMISTIVLAGALVGVYQDMDNRQVRVEAAVEHIKAEAKRIDQSHNRRMDAIRVEQKEAVKKVDRNLDKINNKLDRLIERELNGKRH